MLIGCLVMLWTLCRRTATGVAKADKDNQAVLARCPAVQLSLILDIGSNSSRTTTAATAEPPQQQH